MLLFDRCCFGFCSTPPGVQATVYGSNSSPTLKQGHPQRAAAKSCLLLENQAAAPTVVCNTASFLNERHRKQRRQHTGRSNGKTSADKEATSDTSLIMTIFSSVQMSKLLRKTLELSLSTVVENIIHDSQKIGKMCSGAKKAKLIGAGGLAL